jgi:Uma2 family endonuclease
MQVEATKRLFTVDEYYKMADAGILAEDERTELIDGEIIEMSPIGVRHAAAVMRVTNLLIPLFKGKALLGPQLPLRLNDFNEPQPDIALLKPRKDCYGSRHPGPKDALLVLEISDSSLKYDRGVKLGIYARAGIRELWIADLRGSVLHVYRQPSAGVYKSARQFRRGESTACLAFPKVAIRVDEILG